MSGDERTSMIASAENLDRFVVKSESEILYILNGLMKSAELITVHFNQGQDMMLTTLLSASSRNDELIFDWGGSDKVNMKLLAAERHFFVVAPEGIKVQFSTRHVRQVDFGGEKAFKTNLPDEIIRLQRREYYRAILPGADRLIATFFHQEVCRKLPLHDISIGGIGLIMSRNDLKMQIGDVLSDFSLDLPGLESRNMLLEVRHVSLVTSRRGQVYTRIGCLVVGERKMSDEAKIQRYLIRIEQERRALSREI